MPRTRKQKRLTAAIQRVLNSQDADFDDLACWRRSQKGNLWRSWEELTVTVFRRDDDTFGWSISGGDGVEYSETEYPSEIDAMADLACELGNRMSSE
jgi:hypothetical protein